MEGYIFLSLKCRLLAFYFCCSYRKQQKFGNKKNRTKRRQQCFDFAIAKLSHRNNIDIRLQKHSYYVLISMLLQPKNYAFTTY